MPTAAAPPRTAARHLAAAGALGVLGAFAAGVPLAPAPAAAATLVVANKAEATVSLVDLASGEVRATLPTGQGPHEVAVSPDGAMALVADYGGRQPGSTLTVVDVAGARVVRTIDLGEHRRPHGIAFLPGGERALVTAEGSGSLLVVDVAAGEVVRAIATGQELSHMVAVAPDGSRAYVANIGSGSVTVVDLAAGRRLANVATGDGAEGIAVTPDGAQVWVTNRGADSVSLLDPGSLAVVAAIDSAAFPIRAEVTPDGRYVLVTNARSGDLTVIDAKRREVVRRIALDLSASDPGGRLFGDRFGASSVPIGIEIAPDGRLAWIAHSNADAIQVLDLEAWKPVGVLEAGKEPDGMGYSPLDVRPPAAAGGS